MFLQILNPNLLFDMWVYYTIEMWYFPYRLIGKKDG